MEKGLKWYFSNEGGQDIGPNDPIHQKFKGNPYYSIVREAIQNSLDAVNYTAKPVEMIFDFFELNRLDFPQFFSIEKHMKLCQEYYPKNNQAKKLFDEMLIYLNGTEKKLKKLKLQCLKISDYNTVGMSYKKDDTNSDFYAFLKAAGVSPKLSGAGGSYGFGKGAYYALSPIKTIIASTLDIHGNFYFEGSTRLTTHKNSEGNKLTAFGYYDNGDGLPVTDRNDIPEIFLRKDIGTEVNIIGLKTDRNRKNSMIKSVLNNFWLSIYRNELIVNIDGIEISKKNLENIIDEFFLEQIETGSTTDYENWNPKPYYKAVKYSGQSEQYKVVNKRLPILGEVQLYIYLEKELPNRISYLRKPKMVVYKRTNKKLTGYVGVFVCENERGNELLRQMENPEHNEWKKENFLVDMKPHKNARKAEIELRDFINESLEEISHTDIKIKHSILGLEEYLAIPEDLLGEEDDINGENLNEKYGLSSIEKSDDETGLETTIKKEKVKISPRYEKKSSIAHPFNSEVTDEDDQKILTGPGVGGDKNNNIPSPESNKNLVNASDGEQISRRVIPVSYRVVAQDSSNGIYHVLMIYSNNQIKDAEIELFVGTDNEILSADNNINVIYTDRGECIKNIIKNLQLGVGKNQVTIKFEDNLRHTLKLKAYEIQ